MTHRVKIARPTDYRDMAALHYLSHTKVQAQFASPEWIASRVLEEYESQWKTFLTEADASAGEAQRVRGWKVEQDRAVVGIVKVSPVDENEAHLAAMHVHPDYHRRGIGTCLMESATSFMRNAGYTRASLGVIQANAPARTMYEKFGWKVRELIEIGVEGVPIAIYELELTSPQP